MVLLVFLFVLLALLMVLLVLLFVLQAHSVRLPLETGTKRLRGFGYAEFDTINDLKEALLLKGEVRWASNRMSMVSTERELLGGHHIECTLVIISLI